MLKPSVQVGVEDGILVAEFWDCLRLDPAPVADLRGALEDHVARGGRPIVVVDLLGVGFAGSAALGGFLAIRKRGARLIFCRVEPTVLEVFRVSKLEPLFAFEPDREAALARARSIADGAERGPATDALPTSPAPSPRPASAPPLRRPRGRAGEQAGD
jgi:anti-anti-sigma factor